MEDTNALGESPELVSHPWLDGEELYTSEMVNATVDEDIREDVLLADVLMAVQQDGSYREVSLVLRKGMSKSEVKWLPSRRGAQQYLSVWDYLGVMDDKLGADYITASNLTVGQEDARHD